MEKKTWKTWRQWFKAGQKDHLAGKPIAYPNQPDYVEGYQSVLVTSKEWDATARAADALYVDVHEQIENRRVGS